MTDLTAVLGALVYDPASGSILDDYVCLPGDRYDLIGWVHGADTGEIRVWAQTPTLPAFSSARPVLARVDDERVVSGVDGQPGDVNTEQASDGFELPDAVAERSDTDGRIDRVAVDADTNPRPDIDRSAVLEPPQGDALVGEDLDLAVDQLSRPHLEDGDDLDGDFVDSGLTAPRVVVENLHIPAGASATQRSHSAISVVSGDPERVVMAPHLHIEHSPTPPSEPATTREVTP